MTGRSSRAAEDALMAVIARDGWGKATLSAVATEAGLDLASLVEIAPTRLDVLRGIGLRLDASAIRAAAADGVDVRDRLFDLLMARFDAMTPYKDAIRALARAAPMDPGLAAFFACEVPQSMRRIGDAAGMDVAGVRGALKVHGLGLVYLAAVRAFLADDSADLASTMAALDAALARADALARRFAR